MNQDTFCTSDMTLKKKSLFKFTMSNLNLAIIELCIYLNLFMIFFYETQ